jgi:hypothetical protein
MNFLAGIEHLNKYLTLQVKQQYTLITDYFTEINVIYLGIMLSGIIS